MTNQPSDGDRRFPVIYGDINGLFHHAVRYSKHIDHRAASFVLITDADELYITATTPAGAPVWHTRVDIGVPPGSPTPVLFAAISEAIWLADLYRRGPQPVGFKFYRKRASRRP